MKLDSVLIPTGFQRNLYIQEQEPKIERHLTRQQCVWEALTSLYFWFFCARKAIFIFFPVDSSSGKVGVFDDSIIDAIGDKIRSLHGIFVKYLCHFIPTRNSPCIYTEQQIWYRKQVAKTSWLGGFQDNSRQPETQEHYLPGTTVVPKLIF